MRLGNYELLLELAAGGMATVHVARQLGAAGFERLVVIKRVHANLLRDQEFTDMFRDEARVCSTIRHPHVVPVIDVVQSGGELLLVLEYVESMSLSVLAKAMARTDKLFPPAVASRILCDVLAGLHAAHEAVDMRGNALGLIHRDVSPQNVIVGVDGTSRLIDFGIAKATSRVSITNSGVVKGKLRYMSPEQVQQKTLDRRADVFAAGVVLYEALTGRRPFAGEDDDGDIVVGLLIGEAPPPSSLVPGLSEEVDGVIAKALARSREERFETAAAFQVALERAIPPCAPREVAALVASLGGADLDRRRADLRAALAAAAPAPTKRSKRTVGALAACIVVLGIAALALVVRSRAHAQASAPPERASAAPDPAPSASPTEPPAPAAAPSAVPVLRAPRRPLRPPPSSDLHRRNPYGAP